MAEQNNHCCIFSLNFLKISFILLEKDYLEMVKLALTAGIKL